MLRGKGRSLDRQLIRWKRLTEQEGQVEVDDGCGVPNSLLHRSQRLVTVLQLVLGSILEIFRIRKTFVQK